MCQAQGQEGKLVVVLTLTKESSCETTAMRDLEEGTNELGLKEMRIVATFEGVDTVMLLQER